MLMQRIKISSSNMLKVGIFSEKVTLGMIITGYPITGIHVEFVFQLSQATDTRRFFLPSLEEEEAGLREVDSEAAEHPLAEQIHKTIPTGNEKLSN